MKKRIRMQGMFIFFGVILLILLFRFTTPSWRIEPLEDFFDTLGILLVLCGFLLRIIARGYKEEMSQGGNKLVRDGPYYLVRNPRYFGTLMIGTGVISVLFELWTLPVFLIIYLSIYIPQVNREEKILLTRFGEDYKSYCESTPKYFINFYRLLKVNVYALLIKPSWIKKELSSMLATIIVIFIIEIWQDVRLFGIGEIYDEFLELSLDILIFLLIIAIFAYRKRD
jgi:protein-S-isoprenylcysteine O-methyltransferase Ste14